MVCHLWYIQISKFIIQLFNTSWLIFSWMLGTCKQDPLIAPSCVKTSGNINELSCSDLQSASKFWISFHIFCRIVSYLSIFGLRALVLCQIFGLLWFYPFYSIVIFPVVWMDKTYKNNTYGKQRNPFPAKILIAYTSQKTSTLAHLFSLVLSYCIKYLKWNLFIVK